MMLKKLLIVVAAATLMVTTAGAAPAAVGGSDRPFRATAQGTIWYDFANLRGCGPSGMPMPPATTVVAAKGTATHLGTVTVQATHCESDAGSMLSGNSVDGRMTLIAANGDELYGTYQTHWVVVGANTIDVQGDLAIYGGSGRFRGATGVLFQHHTIALAQQPWTVVMTFAGRLSY